MSHSVVAPVQVTDDTQARIDRNEQMMRLFHVSDGVMSWDGSLVQALYGNEDDIARGLWVDSSFSDSKGNKLGSGPRPSDVGTIAMIAIVLTARDAPELSLSEVSQRGTDCFITAQTKRLMNNVVEYKAYIIGLEIALDLGTQDIWRTQNEKLKPYHAYLDLLIDRFDELRYIHLPRAENQFADALATLASMIEILTRVTMRPLLIETRFTSTYCCLIGNIKDQVELPWKRVKPRKFQKGDLVLRVLKGLISDPRDAILGHTPSSFELFAPQVHRWLSSIVSESPIFSTALRHRVWISFIFDGSPTSCLDPLSFRRLSSIVPGSLFLFYSSPTSCLDPLSFRLLSSIIFGSPIFSVALWHLAQIFYRFDGSPELCLDPLSFRWLFDIVFGSPIFLAALRYCVWIPYLFSGSLALCPDHLFSRWLSSIVSESPIVSTALRHRVRILYLFAAV
uniref:RNase H type-1 domain-containing protein n=1 Tax=Vitis vinifera TaxID=29760 RepID=A5AE57_VITVI|nr:hypothetical protein VITISV_022192 [Vitis vinifera]